MGSLITLFMPWEAKVAVPARNKYHVIGEVLSLDLGLLEHDYVGFKDVEHGL